MREPDSIVLIIAYVLDFIFVRIITTIHNFNIIHLTNLHL